MNLKLRLKVCKLIGHRYSYSLLPNGLGHLRCCLRCGGIEEWRENMTPYPPGWFRLVQYTDKGARAMLALLKDQAKENTSDE